MIVTRVDKWALNSSQESVSNGKAWVNVDGALRNEGTVVKCDNINTRNGQLNKPNPLTVSWFTELLPTDAHIKKITIQYCDRIVSYGSEADDSTFPVFDAPTFSFVGSGAEVLGTHKGEAPTKNFSIKTVDVDPKSFTAIKMNKNNFGVKIQYPSNKSDNVGGIYLEFINLIVEYETPSFILSITEPNHAGQSVSWSTPEDPHICNIGEELTTTVYFRNCSGFEVGEQTITLSVPREYKLTRIIPEEGVVEVSDDSTEFKWYVTPSANKSHTNKLQISFIPTAYNSSKMISAFHEKWGYAFYYSKCSDELNIDGDVNMIYPVFHRLNDKEQFVLNYNVDNVSLQGIQHYNAGHYRTQIKLWSYVENKYVDFIIDENDITVHNFPVNMDIWEPHCDSGSETTYLDLELLDESNFDNKVCLTLYLNFRDFKHPVGDYEFRVFIAHDEDLVTYDRYDFPCYIGEAPHCNITATAYPLEVKTPNIATTTVDGGFAFTAKNKECYGSFDCITNSFRCLLENRVRHIGSLRLHNSHYDPEHEFTNKVNEGSYKNRKYLNKSGEWEESTSLNIHLPMQDWKTLQEFVKMDKPVALDLCPRCSDDDVLNHRGWAEIEAIKNITRTNPFVYDGEIEVNYLTHKYFAKASILKGERVCNTIIPYNLTKVLGYGDFYLNYFDFSGDGQLYYDKNTGVVNEINCGTGQSVNLRTKWALTDIADYWFNWACMLPSAPTDESNDYKYNSIVYKIIDNLSGEIVLTYTLYDFTTYEDGKVVNECNASCTLFKSNTNTNVFNKRIRLDYDEGDEGYFGSTTRFQFNANKLTISESGMSGEEFLEREITLPSREYLVEVSFENNDVGLLEPTFTSFLNIEAYENTLASSYSNFYSDFVVSPFPIVDLNLLFYRHSDDGILYYYYGTSKATYLVDGYAQYKGGVDLQTSSGASIMYIDNFTDTLFINNGLTKIGFDRVFGTVSFYVYDYKTRSWVYVNMLRLGDWSEFELLSYTDDKMVVQFGDTIWTMWRGHPFVQCEHIEVDLIVNDDYDTCYCENIMEQDGTIIYEGKYGKAEYYLYNTLVNVELSVDGTDSDFVAISGDKITLEARVFDNFGVSRGLEYGDSEGKVYATLNGNYNYETDFRTVESIGKIEFSIDGEVVYIDPTPYYDELTKEFVWSYTFVPPYVNADYTATARFIPELHFNEAKSNQIEYSVRRLSTYTEVDTAGDTYKNTDKQFSIFVDNELGTNAEGVLVSLYSQEEGLIGSYVTGKNGMVWFNVKFSKEGFYHVYAVSSRTNTYDSSVSDVIVVPVVDKSKKTQTISSTSYRMTNTGAFDLNNIGIVGKGGQVKVVFDNGKEYTFTKGNSKVITFDKPASYGATVYYYGNSEYTIGSWRITVNGEYIDNNIQMKLQDNNMYYDPESIILGRQVYFTINTEYSNQQYIIYDNGEPIHTGTTSDSGSDGYVYAPSYAGSHVFYARTTTHHFYKEQSSEKKTVSIDMAYTKLNHISTSVYRTQQDIFQLVDSSGEPVVGRKVNYLVNGISYSRTTNSEGKCYMNINLPVGVYPVLLTFNGDDTYYGIELSYNLTVKGAITKWYKPQLVEDEKPDNTAPWRRWSTLDFDSVGGSTYAKCGDGITEDIYISPKNGTHNTPSPIRFKHFKIDIPDNAIVTALRCRWYSRQFNPLGGDAPSIGTGNCFFINLGVDLKDRTGTEAPLQGTTGFNINEVVWNTSNVGTLANSLNIDVKGYLKKDAFTARLSHGANTSNNPADLWLKYFELGVEYVLPSEG